MLGSVLALDLAEAGHTVTLFEAAPELGGLAAAWSVGDVVWDKHYHVTLGSDRNTRELLARLGLEKEIRWVQTRTATWTGDRLHSMSSTLDYIRYPELSLVDKARLAWTILSANRTSDWKALERVSVEAWLRAKSGDRVFDSFWLPLLKSKLGDSYRDTSAAFIWATIQRLYAARSQGMKKELFGYVPGGYARILSTLGASLESAGVEVRLGSRVESISPGRTVTTADGSDSFDHVVLTAAPPIAARVLPGLEPAERRRLEAIRYQGIVCASVVTSKPLDGYYLTYLYSDAPFTAVVEMSALVDRSEFGDRSLIYLPRYCASDDPAFGMSDDELRDRFLPALSRIYPGFSSSDVLAFRVSRVANVFPIPAIRYSELVPSFDTSLPGIHLVNSSQIVNGTLNVNETLALAGRAGAHLMSAGQPQPA